MALQLRSIPQFDLAPRGGYAAPDLSQLGDAFFGGFNQARERTLKDLQMQAEGGIANALLASAGGIPTGGTTLADLGQSAPSYNAGGKTPTFAAIQGNQPSADLKGMFAQAEQKYGLPEGYLTRTAAIESSNNPNAQNQRSSAGGLFQFVDSTAKQYGLTNKFDPVASTDAAGRLGADNKAALARVLGREPTAGELYLAHQQGGGGAAALLANPNESAINVLAGVYAKSGAKDPYGQAIRAVVQNGGRSDMSAGQFAGLWTSKVDGGADRPAPGAQNAQFAIPGQASPASPAAQLPPHVVALLRSQNPFERRQGIAMAQQYMKPTQYGFQTAGDTLYRTDPRTGTATPIQQINKPVQWQRFTSQDGSEYAFNPQTTEAVRILPGGQGYRPMTEQERQSFGIPGETGGFIGPDGKPGALPGTTRIQNTIGEAASQREALADQYGLQGEDRRQFVLNGKLPSQSEKAPTEGQSTAALYATRMRNADAILSKPEVQKAAMSVDRVLGEVPVGGNFLVSSDYQRADQAQRDFVNAVLRRESGAAISASEFENARKQYFPQPGDSEAVLKQKADNRRTAILGIETAAGPAMSKMEQGKVSPSVPVKIPQGMSPQDVRRRFKSGTKIILPDGTEGVVP